jgi:protein-disulfide isomerase
MMHMVITRRNLIVAGAAGLGLAALSRMTRAAPANSLSKAGAAQPSIHLRPPVLGDEKAPKRLVVWGAYTCPFTAQLFGPFRGIVEDMKHVVSVEWRHFPTHPPDPALHVAGLGFKGEHFWGFTFRVLDEVYASGGQISGITPEKLAAFAKAEGGSEETLKAAYADKAKWAAVKEDALAGRLLGITRTPGLFYNGYFITPEGLPFDLKAFDASLRAMLQSS